jgi:hypothetical protein
MAIKIQFIGLCTHVYKRSSPCIPPAHRVILVDATQPPPPYKMEPHRASVTVFDASGKPVIEFRGNGIQCTLDTPGSNLTYERWDMIPSLAVPGGAWQPLDSIVCGRESVAVYFDINGGKLRAVCFGKSVGSELELPDDPQPTLLVQPFAATEESIPLTPNMRVAVKNVCSTAICETPTYNDAEDFRLHYLIGGRNLPENPYMHTTDCCDAPACLPSLGAGCSNSGWP